MGQYTVSDLIHQFLQKKQKSTLFYEQKALNLWKEDLKFCNCISSMYIKNGVIFAHITNAALRFELQTQKTQMIQSLNRRVNEQVVKDIVINC
jgi:hypothetical protein